MADKITFEMYYLFMEKFINRYSYINGYIDEDLRQALAIKVYKLFTIYLHEK